ncbi:MATE family efflux transporter [Vibrio owensii]|uniref:MATE family efflux transporter n=1 Tax=Vibrio owensii TaxID=696485 RepID=UPI0018F21965|nr:MATE family efflux transporter [Vibrio owensii]
MKNELKRLHNLSIPIYVSYMVGVAFTYADNVIIGRYDTEGYAIVTILNTVMYYIIGSIGTFSLAITLLGAKHLEEKDYKRYQSIFNTSSLIGIVISLAFVVAVVLFGESILIHVFSIKSSVLDDAYTFALLLAFCVPLNMMIFSLSSYFKASEQPAILAKSSLVSSITNLFFNYVLVFGKLGFPQLGIVGIAVGSLIALGVNLSIYVFAFLQQSNVSIRIEFKTSEAKRVIKTFAILFMQDLFEFTIFYLLVLSAIAQLGSISAATYGLLNATCLLITMYAFSYGNALMVISRKLNDYKAVTKYTLVCSACFIAAWCGFTILMTLDDVTLSVISDDEQVINNSVRYFLLFSCCQLVVGIATIVRYALNGLGADKFVLKACMFVCPSLGVVIYGLTTIYQIGFSDVLSLVLLTYLALTITFVLKLVKLAKATLACSIG